MSIKTDREEVERFGRYLRSRTPNVEHFIPKHKLPQGKIYPGYGEGSEDDPRVKFIPGTGGDGITIEGDLSVLDEIDDDGNVFNRITRDTEAQVSIAANPLEIREAVEVLRRAQKDFS